MPTLGIHEDPLGSVGVMHVGKDELLAVTVEGILPLLYVPLTLELYRLLAFHSLILPHVELIIAPSIIGKFKCYLSPTFNIY